MNKKPKFLDVFFLACFTIFITYQPYLLHHEIIMMETGIHLPGIHAFFHGATPYKDFLYFRGPLELYVLVFLMKIFGSNMIWLPIFYYVGTVLTLVFVLLLAFQLYRTRLVFYLMVPVFVARTFPRISFYYWGGMRYALGILSLIFAVQSFRSKRSSWMFGAGVVSCLAFWTTIEAGVCTVLAIGSALILSFFLRVNDRAVIVRALQMYILGFLIILAPVAFYMQITGSLVPYIQTTHVVLTKSFETFMNGPGLHPVGVVGFLQAMVPGAKFFQSMTPCYFYIILFVYFVYRKRNNTFNGQTSSLACIAIYGVVLYLTGFRRLDGHHFEMALQPEKILFFFILEEVYLFVTKMRSQEIGRVKEVTCRGWRYLAERKKIYLINFLIFAFIGSSLGYAFTRYNRRFVMAKLLGNKFGYRHDKDLSLLHDIKKRAVNIKKAKGMIVPVWQAEEIEGIVGFLEENTKPEETVFTYPELGNFNFWANRPFVGRFPIATFSWMEDAWHKELVSDFKKAAPRYVIMTNLGHRTFPAEWYFRNKTNIKKFNEITELILNNYSVVRSYESVSLYERK